MAFSRTDNGIYCRGTASGDVDTNIGNPTSTADVLVVTVGGYAAAAAASDVSVSWGNGSSWEPLTQGSETVSGSQYAAVYYKIGPTVSTGWDELRVNSARTYAEGLSVTWAFYSAAGTVTVVDSGTAITSGSGTSSDTLVGGASGDQIYVGGHDYYSGGTAFDLSTQSQTVIETQETTHCNTNHYGHAEKDWSSGATCAMVGYYTYMGCIALNDSGAGGAQTITPGLIASDEAFNNPTVVNLLQQITPNIVASDESFFQPTLVPGQVNITPNLIASAENFFTHTITGIVTITPNLVASDENFFTHNVVPGTVTITPNVIASGESFPTHIVTEGTLYITDPNFIASAETFFTATLNLGTVTIVPSLITSAEAFYTVIVDDGTGGQIIGTLALLGVGK